MRKTISMIILTAVILSLCVLPAGAVSYQSRAEALQDIGVLKGTLSQGLQLDRSPTRLEAAITIVRMMGAEGVALSNNKKSGFVDVPSWGEPYVAYLVDRGVIKGVSKNFFGSHTECSGNTFLILLLRTLGYSDAMGDFNPYWPKVLSGRIGLLDEDVLQDLWTGDFTRGEMAALCYEALNIPIKNSTKTYWNSLKQDSKNAEIKGRTEGLFAVVTQLENAYKRLQGTKTYQTSSELHLTMQNGSVYKQTHEVTKDSGAIRSIVEFGSSADLSVSDMYFADGKAYLATSDGNKIMWETTEAEAIKVLDIPSVLPFSTGSVLSYVSGREDGNTKIHLTVDGETIPANSSLVGTTVFAGGKVVCSDVDLEFTLDAGGNLIKQTITYDFLYSRGSNQTYGIYNKEITVKTEDVEVEVPDLSAYSQVTA